MFSIRCIKKPKASLGNFLQMITPLIIVEKQFQNLWYRNPINDFNAMIVLNPFN